MSVSLVTLEQDSRLGLASASGYGAMIACPGKPNAERGLPELRVEQDDKDANRGTRIHALLAGGTVTLNDEEMEVAERCDSQTQELVCRLLDTNAPYEDLREQRIWYHMAGKKVFSGQFDRIYIQGSIALLIDFKTGRKAVPASQSNYQLRAGAVLARYEFGVETVHAAIVQPLLIREPAVVTYSSEDIDRAEAQLRLALDASSKPDAPRVAGEQCTYCRSRLVCPQSTGAAQSLASVGSMLEKINEMGPADIARLLDLKVPALAVLKAAEAKAKEMLKSDPNSIPGYTLAEVPGKRKITDPQELFHRASVLGVGAMDFAAKCKMSIKDITALIRKATSWKGAELSSGVGETLQGIAEKGKPTMKLVRVGEAIEESEEE